MNHNSNKFLEQLLHGDEGIDRMRDEELDGAFKFLTVDERMEVQRHLQDNYEPQMFKQIKVMRKIMTWVVTDFIDCMVDDLHDEPQAYWRQYGTENIKAKHVYKQFMNLLADLDIEDLKNRMEDIYREIGEPYVEK